VLLDHLKRMHDLDYMLTTMSNQQAFEEFLDETERHLHNYVAATQSRVEHFRRFTRAEWPESSPHRAE
jgi:nucleoid-associated protein YejK